MEVTVLMAIVFRTNIIHLTHCFFFILQLYIKSNRCMSLEEYEQNVKSKMKVMELKQEARVGNYITTNLLLTFFRV